MIAKIYLKNYTSTIKEFTNLCHKLYNISYLAVLIVGFWQFNCHFIISGINQIAKIICLDNHMGHGPYFYGVLYFPCIPFDLTLPLIWQVLLIYFYSFLPVSSSKAGSCMLYVHVFCACFMCMIYVHDLCTCFICMIMCMLICMLYVHVFMHA